MPLYEYECERCRATKEVLQNLGASAPEVCPSCGAEGTMSRGVSQTSFHLKGSGWYVTDYKAGATKKKKEGESESGSEASAPAEKTGAKESTPEAAPAETAPKKAAPKSSGSDLKTGGGA